MFSANSIKILPALVFSAFVLVACDKEEESPSAGAAISEGASILQYIPADSPYVFVGLEPIPDEIMDNLEPKLDRVLKSYQTILNEMVSMKQAELSEEERNSEDAQRMEAFVAELSTLLSLEGLRSAGIDRGSKGALYGNGLLPVIRMELTDGARFEDTLASLEDKAGQEMLVGSVGDQSYRYFDAEELRIVIAVVDNQAVISIVPSVFDEDQTGRALGLTLPDQNIASTGILEALIEDYGYTNHFVGFVDVLQVVESFIGDPTGLDADLMAVFEGDKPEVSDVCKDEFRDVAGIAPRMVVGYTSISANRFDSSVVFELRDDIASGLQALTAPVPGLGGDAGGLMSFGMSLDIGATRSFIEDRLDAMEADPFECEHFADLQSGAAEMRATLSQPVMPMIYDFRGFLAVIDEIEGLDVATQTPPTSVDGSFLLAMNNAQALIAFGAMMSPELAALNLQPGGDPVALDIPQLQAMGIMAYAAMEDDALAISVGDDAESEVVAVLEADIADPSPFMGFSIDAARYYSFMGEAVAAGDDMDSDAASPEMRAATQEMMNAIADLYDRMTADVLFTDDGVEFRMIETLKD